MTEHQDLPWRRLHPLSPLVHMARSVAALVVVLAVPYLSSSHRSAIDNYIDLAILVLATVTGVISWLVTRWRVQSETLLVETGLLRRRHTRIPLQRIQSVDVIRPAVARLFGLAEVRVRTGVAHDGDARLAYVAEEQADSIRALLTGWSQRGQPPPTGDNSRPPTRVRTVRLLLAVWLDGSVLALLLLSVAFIAAGELHAAHAGAALVGTGAGLGLLGLLGVGSRLNSQLNYEVLVTSDSLTVRGGLLGTVVESLPRHRIQAIRMAEPMLWRPFGWVRLEVDVAGGQRRKKEDRAAAGQLRVVLPVAPRRVALDLLRSFGPAVAPDLAPAPPRARLKTPLSYHFLMAGTAGTWAAASTGRLRRLTTWVPLSKVQSVRWTQGPVQRRLLLASVHLDIPGRRLAVAMRDRSAQEANQLTLELPGRCHQARVLAGSPPSPRAWAAASGAGCATGAELDSRPGPGPAEGAGLDEPPHPNRDQPSEPGAAAQSSSLP